MMQCSVCGDQNLENPRRNINTWNSKVL